MKLHIAMCCHRIFDFVKRYFDCMIRCFDFVINTTDLDIFWMELGWSTNCNEKKMELGYSTLCGNLRNITIFAKCVYPLGFQFTQKVEENTNYNHNK